MKRLTAIAALALLAAEPAPLDVRPVLETSVEPFTVLMQLGEARRAAASGDDATAITLYRSLLAVDPGMPDARTGLAASLLAVGKTVEADAALGTAPDPVIRLLIDSELGRLSDAEAALRDGFRDTRDPRLANALGRRLDDQGRGRDARTAFLRAAPHQRPGVAQNNIGLSFLREGELDRAQAAFAAARALDPEDGLFRRNHRLCALMRGDYATGLDGLRGDDAAPLLREAGAGALSRGETALARLLLDRASDLSVRHDPRIAALQERLDK